MTKQKTIFVLLLFFLSFGYLKAQKVTWGQEIKEDNRRIYALLQTTKGIFCVYLPTSGLLSSTSKIEVHRYNLKLQAEKQADIKIEAKNYLNKVIILEDEIYFIFLKDEKGDDKGYYALKLDQNTLTLGQPILLDKLKDRKGVFSDDEATFKSIYSPDKSKILVIGYPGQKKKEQQKISLTVLDTQLKTLWKREEELGYEENLFAPQDYAVDNNGVVFLLAKVYKEKVKEKKDGESNYKYSMFIYANATEKSKEFSINLDGVLVAQIGFMLDNDSNPLCAGFYYDNNRRSGYIGMFFCKIDIKANAVINKNIKPFDDTIVKQLSGEKAVKKNRGVNATFQIKEFLQRSDGGFTILAENSYIYTRTRRSGNMTYYDTYYNKDQILAMQVDASGKISWVTGIDKQQRSTNDGGYLLSFGSGLVDDNIFLVFNVSAKGYAKNKDIRYDNDRKSALVCQKINKDGTTSNSLLFNNNKDDIETVAIPRKTFQVSANEILILTQKRSKQRIARITF